MQRGRKRKAPTHAQKQANKEAFFSDMQTADGQARQDARSARVRLALHKPRNAKREVQVPKRLQGMILDDPQKTPDAQTDFVAARPRVRVPSKRKAIQRDEEPCAPQSSARWKVLPDINAVLLKPGENRQTAAARRNSTIRNRLQLTILQERAKTATTNRPHFKDKLFATLGKELFADSRSGQTQFFLLLRKCFRVKKLAKRINCSLRERMVELSSLNKSKPKSSLQRKIRIN
jgi:hypothetical protein